MLTWNKILERIKTNQPKPDRRVEKTEDEWRSILTPEQFRITRQRGTERRFSGALCHVYDPGTYSCLCCDTPLFDATEKFDSGTGWPSFSQPIKDNAIKYIADHSFGMTRVETVCNTCDAHLGHVFRDGIKTGGLRYCINSEAIKLINDEK